MLTIGIVATLLRAALAICGRGLFRWWCVFTAIRNVPTWIVYHYAIIPLYRVHGHFVFGGPTDAFEYRAAFALGEGLNILLLAAVGASECGWPLWCGALGWMFAAQHWFPIHEMPLRTASLCRAAVVCATMAALMFQWRWTAFRAILAAWCAIDAVAYLSMLLGARHAPAELILAGQTACLAAWLVQRIRARTQPR